MFGACSDFAAAFGRDPAAECAGVLGAQLYARPGHPLITSGEAVQLPLLAKVFPPLDVLDTRAQPPTEIADAFVDLVDASGRPLADLGAAVLRLSPAAYVVGGSQDGEMGPSGLANDLDRTALAANAMVVLAVVTALVAGTERLLSRRAVLAHLSAVGMTRRQARLAAGTEFALGIATALVVGLSSGLVAGYALVTGLGLEVVPAWDRLLRAIAVLTALGLLSVVLVQRRMTRSFDATALRIE